MTAEQRSLLGWTAAVAIFAALVSIGSLSAAWRSLQGAPADARLAQFEQRYGSDSEGVKQLQLVTEQTREVSVRVFPLHLASLGPYAAAALLLGGLSLWARRDAGKARYVAPAAVLVTAVRLWVAAVELHVASITTAILKGSMSAGLALASRDKPAPEGVHTFLRVMEALAGGEIFVGTIAWSIALCSFYGYVAWKLWPRPYSPASLRPL